MKILNLLPVTANVCSDEMAAYMNKFLEETTETEVWQIKTGPYTIECEYDEALAGPSVLELCKKAEQEGFDAIFIDCFGDPCVKAARELVDIPVFGGFEPATHIALGLADRICIVTVMSNVISLMRGNLAKAHLNERVVNIRAVDIPVDQLGDHQRMVDALIDQSIKAVEVDGAQAIVLGCTGFVGVAEEMKIGLMEKGYDIPVLEAAQSAMKMCEMYAKMGLKQSRLTYMKPPVHPE